VVSKLTLTASQKRTVRWRSMGIISKTARSVAPNITKISIRSKLISTHKQYIGMSSKSETSTHHIRNKLSPSSPHKRAAKPWVITAAKPELEDTGAEQPQEWREKQYLEDMYHHSNQSRKIRSPIPQTSSRKNPSWTKIVKKT